LAAGEQATLVNAMNAATKAVTYGQSVTMAFDIAPANTAGTYVLTATPLSGSAVARSVTKAAGTARIQFTLGVLPVGYYDLTLTLGGQTVWPGAHGFVVVPAGAVPNEKRFGMDAGLSWGNNANSIPAEFSPTVPGATQRAVDLIRLAGVGSTRERLTWTDVTGDSAGATPNWNPADRLYAQVAAIQAQAGLDVVGLTHSTPLYAQPERGSVPATAPTDYQAVYDWGQTYAQGLGQWVSTVEYYNEVNNVENFNGYPFQYASGFKAFAAGVKSVRPDLAVLMGSPITGKFQYFDEVYANNAGAFADVANQHFYGLNDERARMGYSKTALDTYYDSTLDGLYSSWALDQVPSYMTEMGYALFADQAGNFDRAAEITQAEYLAQTYALGFATGYERVFYFYWQYLTEPLQSTGNVRVWGMVNRDASPRPAYLTLSIMTRFLQGAEVAGSVAHGAEGKGRTVYFRQASGALLAVTWGGGSPAFNGSFQATDVFGQALSLTQAQAQAKTELMFVSGIGNQLPSETKVATTNPDQVQTWTSPMWLETRVKLNGVDQFNRNSNDLPIDLVVTPATTIDVVAQAHHTNAAGQRATLAPAKAAVTCTPGPGLVVAAGQPTWDATQQTWTCRFTAKPGVGGSTYAQVTVTDAGQSDFSRVALRIEPTGGYTTVNPGPGTCATWVEGGVEQTHSGNLSPWAVVQNPTTCAVDVTGTVMEVGATWAGPYVEVPESYLATVAQASGIRVKLSSVPGTQDPPSVMVLQLHQTVEAGGGTWHAPFQDQGNGYYTVMFNDLTNLGFENDKDGEFDRAAVAKIRVAWGTSAVELGAVYGFRIESLEFLPGIGDLLKPGGACPEYKYDVANWNYSGNVALTVARDRVLVDPLTHLCATSVFAKVKTASTSAFAAAELVIPEDYRSTLAGSSGLRLALNPIGGQGPMWPTGTTLTIQVIESSGAKWLTTPPKGEDGTYSFKFKDLFNATNIGPVDPNGKLDLDQVTKIMVSWGGGQATVQTYAFRVEFIEVLPAEPSQPLAIQRATVSGSPTVGSQLTADVAYTPADATVVYRWFRGTSVIPGATGLNYTLQAADAGRDLVLKVTASKDGQEVNRYSAHILVLGVASLSVSGTPRVGQTLTAAAVYQPTDGTVTYQWFKGTSVVGTGASYTVRAADVGGDMVLKLTVAKAGVGSVSRYSAHFTPTA
jgi:hypothetical protein